MTAANAIKKQPGRREYLRGTVAAVDGRWRLETWGDTTHLEAGALDELPS